MNKEVYTEFEHDIFTIIKKTDFTLSDILKNVNKEENRNKFILLITDTELTTKDILNNKEFFGNYNTYVCNYQDYKKEIDNSLSPKFMPMLIVAEKGNIISINPMLNLKKVDTNV